MKESIKKKIEEWDLTGIDEELLLTALMHPSYDTAGKRNNQRLEFLGDAVLGLVLAEELYSNYPRCHEGELTRLRALLAQEATLANVAREIGLGDILLLGKGEANDGGRRRSSTLADAMESLIAAVYLSFGLKKAVDFVWRYFGVPEKRIEAAEAEVTDYKTAIQEYAQSLGFENVTYKIIKEEGPPHLRIFTAAVYYHGNSIGEGHGKSKKEAEKNAAAEGYRFLKQEESKGNA